MVLPSAKGKKGGAIAFAQGKRRGDFPFGKSPHLCRGEGDKEGTVRRPLGGRNLLKRARFFLRKGK